VRLPSPLFFEFQFQGDQFVKKYFKSVSIFASLYTQIRSAEGFLYA
jgi:hypothetical protein